MSAARDMAETAVCALAALKRQLERDGRGMLARKARAAWNEARDVLDVVGHGRDEEEDEL